MEISTYKKARALFSELSRATSDIECLGSPSNDIIGMLSDIYIPDYPDEFFDEFLDNLLSYAKGKQDRLKKELDAL